jgi:hypothetical protein
MARFQENNVNKNGYNQIHDSITHSKTMAQLKEAIEKAIPLMKQFKLDSYQQKKLEEYGIRKYENLLMEDHRIAQIAKHNKFRK